MGRILWEFPGWESVLGLLAWPCERMVESQRPTQHSLPLLRRNEEGEGRAIHCVPVDGKTYKSWVVALSGTQVEAEKRTFLRFTGHSCPCVQVHRGDHEFMHYKLSPLASWCPGGWCTLQAMVAKYRRRSSLLVSLRTQFRWKSHASTFCITIEKQPHSFNKYFRKWRWNGKYYELKFLNSRSGCTT